MDPLVREFLMRIRPTLCSCGGRGFWIFPILGARNMIERCDHCKVLGDDRIAACLVKALVEAYIATGDKAA